MEIAEKQETRGRKAKHGPNAKIARMCKNMTQDSLAFKMEMSQSKISALELQDEIDDATLDKLAAALEVPVDFLRNFVLEEAMSQYTIANNTFTNTSAENSNEKVTQQIVGEQEIINHNYPLDDIKELYNKLLLEKDKQINKFEEQIEKLQQQLEELRTALMK